MPISVHPSSQVVIIMRGVPGSGKSTHAAALIEYLFKKGFMAEASDWYSICSADHSMVDRHGQYRFDPNKLKKAHALCQEKFSHSLKNNTQLVIVDNTNIHFDHIEFYLDMALRHSYEVFQWQMTTHFQSIHNVPVAVIDRMQASYQPISLPDFELDTEFLNFLETFVAEKNSMASYAR